MTELRDRSHPRFPLWQPPTCPVLTEPNYHGSPLSKALAWVLQAQYPDCVRLDGGGYCGACVCDVVPTQVVDDHPKPPPPLPPITLWHGRHEDSEGPRWRPI